jgi:hypothetical protein
VRHSPYKSTTERPPHDPAVNFDSAGDSNLSPQPWRQDMKLSPKDSKKDSPGMSRSI